MNYTQIINYFLSTAAIIAGVVYIAKLIVDKFMDSRIEHYKNSLQKHTESFRHKLNLEAEKFKHDLNTKTVEHQIKYSKLYEERGQVIKLIYNLLLELEDSLKNLTTIQESDWTTGTERDKETKESINNLRQGLEQNRIFFTRALCEKMQLIISDSSNIRIEMSTAKMNKQKNESNIKYNILVSDEDLLKPLYTWVALEKKVQNEIKTARLDLAQEFRGLIGVE